MAAHDGLRQGTERHSVDHEMRSCQTMTYELHQASLENLLLNTSSVSQMSFEAPLVETGDIVSENLHRFHAAHFSNNPQTSDKSMVFTAVPQAIELQGSAEESIIAIVVPDDISGKQAFLTSQPFLQDHPFTEEGNLIVEHIYESAEESSEMEHSYCRLDLDRNQLWETIAKLQSKIALLEVQENVTLARLRSLEALIGQLKQENLLSDEKLKIIDNCQNGFDFAVMQ